MTAPTTDTSAESTAQPETDPDAENVENPVDVATSAVDDAATDESGDQGDVVAASVSVNERKKAKEDGDTYPGTDQFPIGTRDQAEAAVRLYGRSDLPAEKVKAWLMRRLKAKGWDDLIPDAWKSGKAVTAALQFDDDQRAAITAAATALLDKLGPAQAYRQAPLIFWTPESLAIADGVIEPPIDDPEALTAAGSSDLPPISLFDPPADLPPGTGHYVANELTDGKYRRVYGRLAEWDVPHIGFDGRPVYPPRTKSGYRWFHTKSTWVNGANGPERLKIGHLTFGTGHASTDPSVGHLAAAAHYDNSGYRGAKVRMTEDQYGPVYSGITVAGLDGPRLEEFSESDTSGDWRRIMGNLELVAALCVNVGGFPKVGLSLAASGEPLALVASAKAWGRTATFDYDAMADAVVQRIDQRETAKDLLSQRDALLASLDDTADVIQDLLAEVDDTAVVAAALLADLSDVDQKERDGDALVADISRMPPQLMESYLHGKAAAKIIWGSPGDFKRCELEAEHHGIPKHMRAGMCATLHKLATGAVPGQAPAERALKK
jgi:hypothetical protein